MRRFWDLVDRGDQNACWPWRGGRDARGRPFFTSIGGLRILADRFAYELSVGPLARGEILIHACGQEYCVNPRHLTRSARPSAAPRTGRYRRGSGSKVAKLSEAAVRDIRRRVAAGETHVALAAEYGVSQSSISRAASGHAWKHVR